MILWSVSSVNKNANSKLWLVVQTLQTYSHSRREFLFTNAGENQAYRWPGTPAWTIP